MWRCLLFYELKLVHTHRLIFCLKGRWTSADLRWEVGWWGAWPPAQSQDMESLWVEGTESGGGWPQGTQSTIKVCSAKGSNTDVHLNLGKQSARSMCCKCKRCEMVRDVEGRLWGHGGVRSLKKWQLVHRQEEKLNTNGKGQLMTTQSAALK